MSDDLREALEDLIERMPTTEPGATVAMGRDLRERIAAHVAARIDWALHVLAPHAGSRLHQKLAREFAASLRAGTDHE